MSVIEAPGSLTRGHANAGVAEIYVSGSGANLARATSSTVGPTVSHPPQAVPHRSEATRSELIGHALFCAVEVSRSTRVDDLSVRTLLSVLGVLVEDDFPTPQVSASGDGSIMAKWIVNHRSLTVDCTRHVVDIWAHDDRGNEFLADELDGRFFAMRPVAQEAREYLRELSAEVANRITVRKRRL